MQYIDDLKKHIKQFKSVHYMIVIFAIATQIQITLFAQGNYLGLRISLADLLLPFAGVFILSSLIKKKSELPNWSVNNMYAWIVALILVMSSALINGYIVNETLSQWAFINKYVGFFILLSYLALGGWIIQNAENSRDSLSLFMITFAGFFTATILASMLLFLLQYFVQTPLWLPRYPWDGFMANRNAFMVIFVLSFTYIMWMITKKTTASPLWVTTLFWFCMPTFFVFNESRTGWIIAAVLALIFLIKNPTQFLKKALPLFLAGIALTYGSYHLTTKATAYILEGRQIDFLVALTQEEQGDLSYIGDQKRYIALEDGLELYSNYNPLIGAGLGSYQPFQIEKRGEFIEIMDFTGLWLLTETGAIGLSVFIAFFMACVYAIYKTGYRYDTSPYHRSMLIFLIMFAVISVLHEVMYTRALWIAIGLALVPLNKQTTPPLSSF